MHLSEVGELAAQSQAIVADQLDLAMLLGVEAYQADNNYKTRSALLQLNQIHPHLSHIFSGYSASVECVAYSPDGKTMASGYSDGAIILWDIASGQPVGSPLGDDNARHTKGVISLAFSPDGKLLASGGYDERIILWDLESWQGQRLPAYYNYIHSLSFSPDGKILASGNSGFTIDLWDVASQQQIGEPLKGHKNALYTAPLSARMVRSWPAAVRTRPSGFGMWPVSSRWANR